MAVKSEPLNSAGRSTPVHAKESAVVSRSRLRKQRGAIERATAWGVLFLSFLGTVVWIAGGWPVFIAGLRAFHPAWSAIVWGLLIQGLLTFLEWYYFDHPLVSYPARLVDTVLTALGYGPLVLVALAAFLTARNAPVPDYLAWLIIGVVSYVFAWYPESRLVE